VAILSQNIQGRYPLKPLQETTLIKKCYLVLKQDIQGRYPLKPLQETTLIKKCYLVLSNKIFRGGIP